MEWKIYEFKPGQEIILNRKYISYVVNTFTEKEKDNSETELVVYKDWNKHKQRWDYHVENTMLLSYQIDLYKREKLWLSDYCPNKKRYKRICNNYKLIRIIKE